MEKEVLEKLYLVKKKSAMEIAKLTHRAPGTIDFWLKEYKIPKRSISEAIYVKRNPKGDPFEVMKPKNIDQAILYGIGLGLYWGEGNKLNKTSIRLGNTDPRLVKKFMEFLLSTFKIHKNKLHFGLQVFSDMDADKALTFWIRELRFPKKQFQKVVVTKSRGKGTYGKKTKYGVLTVYYNNKKLRDILCGMIEKM